MKITYVVQTKDGMKPCILLMLLARCNVPNARGFIPTCRQSQFTIGAENGWRYITCMPNRQHQPGFLFLGQGEGGSEEEKGEESEVFHGMKIQNFYLTPQSTSMVSWREVGFCLPLVISSTRFSAYCFKALTLSSLPSFCLRHSKML